VGSPYGTESGQQDQSLRYVYTKRVFLVQRTLVTMLAKKLPAEISTPPKPRLHEYNPAALPWAKPAKPADAAFTL